MNVNVRGCLRLVATKAGSVLTNHETMDRIPTANRCTTPSATMRRYW
jgi:hypothetical protein